jgi:tetratricopeptide (TPR) repeat protein
MDGNNFAIELTIASTLDTDTINEQIANILKSQENIKAINSLQKQNVALLKRLAELEKQHANAKTDEQKELVRQEYAAAKDQAETMSDLEKTLSFTIERLNEVDRDRAMEYYERGEEAYKIAEPYTRRYIFTYDDMNEHKRGMNQFNTAIAQYTKALKIDPNMLEAYWRRGFSYYHLDDYKNAIADFDRLVALKPTVKHYEIRAQAHAHFGKYDDALKDYAKALALDPYDRSVYEERAIRVYFAAKEYKTAMQDLFKICELGDCGLITYIFYRAKSSLLSNPDYTHFILNNIVANEDFIRESREYIREITKEARKACESGDCNRLKLLREIGVLLD